MTANYHRHYFGNLSIRYKLIIYFVLVISLLLFSLGFVLNIIYSRIIEKAASDNTSMMISQVNQNVESYIDKTENVIDMLSKQPEIISFLNLTSMYNDNRIGIETDARSRLTTVKESYPEIEGILVANESDLYVSNELYRESRNLLSDDEWYNKAILNPSEFQLISKPTDRNLATSLSYTSNDIVSVSKAVLDPETNRYIGVILVDLKIDTFKSIVESAKFGKSGFVYMADRNGEIIFTSSNPVVYRINNNWLQSSSSGPIIKGINGIRYQIIYSVSENTGWKTIGVFSLNEVLGVVVLLRYYTFAIAAITFMLAIIISIYFTASIVRPINKLKKLMKKVEDGNLDIIFNSASNDEIGQLGQGFNHMLYETRHLIEVVGSEQKSKREAELRLLQSQIKPHFLYNTLDNIQWMAQEHHAQDIVDIVAALTTLFRYTIGKGGEFVQVREELEHITSYLYIQKVRYEEKLNYTIEMSDEILNLYMLRLSLQPLVENAIYHGIKEKRGSGQITLTGEIQDGQLYFSVRDNGTGISPEKLQEINRMLNDRSLKNTRVGYGIYNVNERIKLTFGPEYGLKYSSILGEGTTVEVFYPIVKEGN